MRRIIVGLLTLCLTLVIVLGAYLAVDPVGFRRHVFQPLRELRLLHQELDVVRDWSSVRRVVQPAPEVVVLDGTDVDEPSLVADIYRTKIETTPAPAMLVLHGSAPWGRKAGLIRLLGSRLAEHGWIVMAPDARGFGDSDLPANSADPHAWDVAKDVRRSLDHLASRPEVDFDRIYVLGHSMGANHALEGALGDPRVRGLILIGPSRFELEDLSQNRQWWLRVRFAADRTLSSPLETDAMRRVLERSHLPRYLRNGLTTRGEQPILFMDGALEGAWNLAFLDTFIEQVPPPMERITLPGTGHYCGVWNFWGGDTVWYRPDLFNPFLANLLDFLATNGDQ